MSKLTIFMQNGVPVTDSREVSEMTGKDHSHLLRDIRGYIEVMKSSENPKLDYQDFFIERTFKVEGNNKTYDRFDLTRIGCDMVANKMTGKKGVLFTATYVSKFEKMEKELKNRHPVPSYMLDNPVERAERWIQEQREKLLLEEKVSDYEKKAEYVDVILQSKGTVTTSQIAKDYGLSAVKLNEILNESKIQYVINKQWVLYAKYADKGYTQSHSFDFTHKDGTPDVKMNTRWTQRGRLFVHDVLTELGYKANIDKEFFDAK